jgi:cystathionine beta-lyase/cystathionine gamma-synthase
MQNIYIKTQKNEKSAFGQRFSKMDIFKNVQKPKAPNFPGKNLAKKRVVTIMLSFSFFREKCCDANFFYISFGNHLGTFLC